MHNYCKTIGALAAVSALVAGNATAEVEYELHTGYSSEYLFRGRNLGQDLIEMGADVKGMYNEIGLSAGAWYGNVQNAAGSGINDLSFDELDLYADISYDFGWAKASVGYINRQYSVDGTYLVDETTGDYERLDGPDSEQEVYFSLSRQFWGIDTSLTYYWDIETDNDGYSELKMKRTWELSPCLNLNTGGDVGYLVEEGDFTAITLRTSLDWGFAGTAKLSPFMAYSISLTDGREDTAYWHAGNEFVGGLMLSAGF